ncbi:conserved membrane protein, multidrug efflux associated [Richelia intracellularis HH01]|uniref:Conserved membrane protein, multidrug efflux associated n=1 Tax=Richelia intracellularis HH01 TaxID=1165094 RepID=M1X556_9NOST|nr:conserved membrane protein, multidrug efflux associated [Richelia intracellularis HH01]
MGSTSIWFIKIYSITQLLQGLLEAGRYDPMIVYPTAYRFFFTFVIPVAFLTTFPVQAILGRGQIHSFTLHLYWHSYCFLFPQFFGDLHCVFIQVYLVKKIVYLRIRTR